MQELYADVIIDISHEAIDRAFQYKIPEELLDSVKLGCQVNIPFGKGDTMRKGYVTGISAVPKYAPDKIKCIASVSTDGVAASGRLLALAAWIKENYGSTMINAIQTVLPVKKTVRGVVNRYIVPTYKEDYDTIEYRYMKRNAKAKLRLLREIRTGQAVTVKYACDELGVSRQAISQMEAEGVISVVSEAVYRDVIPHMADAASPAPPDMVLSSEQQNIVDEFDSDVAAGVRGTYLLHGVTGSGKTEVYVRCIQRVIAEGRQAIMLIPEIALTYQTVSYFTRYFGSRVTIINSRLSSGEKYDQFERARKGEVDVVIGPRSALFTPFERLGLIIMDEEHEGSYKSDTLPKYHAREVALKRAEMENASVILGSATPSIESYDKAVRGEYKLWTMKNRISGRSLAETSVVDLRDELKHGNRSIISRELADDIADRLGKKEQVILFINRRGYNSCVSCRSCGEAVKCPHCDVSMTKHGTDKSGARLICHYCGYSITEPKSCPSCGSRLIGGYGVGTEKVEQEVSRLFPDASVLRMDRDTTARKNAHEEILSRFGRGEADILVGTQMIVKGLDFANVTLVGILLADLTMFSGDYRAGERTFDLLTQAAGRAGRGDTPGKVVIQTYKPDNYAVLAAAKQDYESFYETESAYRSLMRYPPEWNMMVILASGEDKEQLVNFVDRLYSLIREKCKDIKRLSVVGPAEPAVEKIRDVYRRVLYIKHSDYGVLVDIKDDIEGRLEESGDADRSGIGLAFDFNPMNMY